MDPYRPGEVFAAWAELNRRLLGRAEGVAGGHAPAAATLEDLAHWLDATRRYHERSRELCERLLRGGHPEPVATPAPDDRRFQASVWEELPWFDYLKQAYLIHSEWLLELAGRAQLEDKAKAKLLFFTRRYLDALSPANFLATNPEALELAAATEGESAARGLRNLLADLERGRISLADESAFEVGRNLATTPGAVVHENELMQLIQYAPLADTVHGRPLVIVPPCISKYYLLDLRPENSFVRYCLEQGHAVFLVSWRNPSAAEGHFTWDDYVDKGVLEGLGAALAIGGAKQANTLGFCVGGVLLACAAALERARGADRIASLTLLASMLDYEHSGDLGALIDRAYVEAKEAELRDGGVVRGSEVALAFGSLRANEFIWAYVVQNYLKGGSPPAVDLLYWTSDQPNLAGAMYRYYIRNMYLENSLRAPGKLAMCGTPVDLSRVDVPAYVFGAREDHISPWKCTYASARLLGGEVEYVLGAAGHVAGVVSPPAKRGREFQVNGERNADPERWLATAKSRPGSWWPHWSAWLAPRAGAKVRARKRLGGAGYREIEPAPGRYVKVRNP